MEKARNVKPPSQKAMLSQALQKANTAVQLDNASNLEGARQAYAEACELLEQVLSRTTTEEDQRKLEAIRQTYASRIEELDQMGPWPEDMDKALPERPESEDYQDLITNQFRAHGQNGFEPSNYSSNLRSQEWDVTSVAERIKPSQSAESGLLQSSFSRQSIRSRSTDQDVPAPLGSGRQEYIGQGGKTHRAPPISGQSSRHRRDLSQNSWLDGIGESGDSTNSSIHSRTSSLGYRRKHLRGASGNTETEFDTALDAAIEAAYDDGFEPAGIEDYDRRDNDDVVAKVLRKVEIARERVRQTERETYGYSSSELRQQLGKEPRGHPPLSREASGGFYNDNSSDEEERMLEQLARDYEIKDYPLDGQQNGGGLRAPKQEMRPTSSRANAAPNHPPPSQLPPLSLNKKPSLPSMMGNLAPAVPPPQASLPELPAPRPASPQLSVRSRRLSGQKQLKIETSKLPSSLVIGPKDLDSRPSLREDDAQLMRAEIGPSSNTTRPKSPPAMEIRPLDDKDNGIVSPSGLKGNSVPEDQLFGTSGSPSTKTLRKNISSSSLRSMKSRNMSLPNLDDGSDMSPSTTLTNPFTNTKAPFVPTVPTPLTAEFRDAGDIGGGGLNLFDDSLHPPATPHSPIEGNIDAPVPLEYCPAEALLRPFWLMRCLFQTLVHPRGGYVSTKLFVPREVWAVKGVKLKNVDDKIANCDLLTAACLKLAQVDTCDADAVLDEMQSLEGILEQVQAALTRKLGSDVGVNSSGSIFKEASTGEGEGGMPMPRSGSVSNKPSSFSWRRLRPKNSAVGLTSAYNSRSTPSELPKESSVASLPITPQPTSRPPRRDLSLAQFTGPNATYMNSLARLFDAAQAIGT